MHSKCNHVVEPPSWSSQSGSPSPPPPPLPPPVLSRWARAEQRTGVEGGCPHCRGRLSVPTRTTSLSSYSCKGESEVYPKSEALLRNGSALLPRSCTLDKLFTLFLPRFRGLRRGRDLHEKQSCEKRKTVSRENVSTLRLERKIKVLHTLVINLQDDAVFFKTIKGEPLRCHDRFRELKEGHQKINISAGRPALIYESIYQQERALFLFPADGDAIYQFATCCPCRSAICPINMATLREVFLVSCSSGRRWDLYSRQVQCGELIKVQPARRLVSTSNYSRSDGEIVSYNRGIV